MSTLASLNYAGHRQQCLQLVQPVSAAEASLAGLGLLERFGGWDQRPLDANSARHVSVYGRA